MPSTKRKGSDLTGKRVSKQLAGQGAFLFVGTVVAQDGEADAQRYQVEYDLGQDGCKAAKHEWLTADELAPHLTEDEAPPTEPSGCRWSNQYVSADFLKHHPEQESSWLPVDERFEGKLSPQSGKALRALNELYSGLDNAWNSGWRWMLLPNNHMWYPPKHESPEYAATVKKYARGGKNKMSIKSPDVHHVLAVIAALI